MHFSDIIIGWYQKNKRDLPWRNTNNAYFIWLSEVILQQTRVAQGLNYYIKFIETYPTVTQLANAPLDDVLKLWQGLGYYSRARNLHKAANEIEEKFNGKFPTKFEDILSLKGVGEYTASAVASFTNNLPHAVLDGNVYRVLARYYGMEIPINANQAKKYYGELAFELLDKKNSGLHNQAIMEFGALQCVPVSPNCLACPLNNSCVAFHKNLVTQLPIKEKKLKVKERFFNYFFIQNNGYTFIQQRPSGDIWEGLFEFPLIETNDETSVGLIIEEVNFKSFMNGNEYTITNVSNPIKHILTHRHIYCKFFEIEINFLSKKSSLHQFQKVRTDDLKKYAIPRLIDRYLQLIDKNKLSQNRLF